VHCSARQAEAASKAEAKAAREAEAAAKQAEKEAKAAAKAAEAEEKARAKAEADEVCALCCYRLKLQHAHLQQQCGRSSNASAAGRAGFCSAVASKAGRAGTCAAGTLDHWCSVASCRQ
jgi:membrane protein involved in colicin uptake